MKKQPWVWLSAAVLGVVCGLALSSKPWMKMEEQKATRIESEKTLKSKEAEHAELAKKEAQVRTPTGQEAIARERGYHKVEEKPWEAPR